jgi:starvation-inducible DNA-binding protein
MVTETHTGAHGASYLEDSDQSAVRLSVCTSLQSCLVDLIELQLQAKQAHWNLVGKEFRSLHHELDEIVDAAREGADEVAERIRALDGVADGRSETVSASTTFAKFPEGTQPTELVLDLIIDRLGSASKTLRDAQSVADQHDPPSSDLLNGIVLELEKQRWMLRAAYAPQ